MVAKALVPGIVLDGGDEAVAVDALAKRHPAEEGVAQQVIDLVRVEGAAEDIGQQKVAGGDLAIPGLVVDDVGHPHRVHPQLVPQHRGDAAPGVLDEQAGPPLVAHEEGAQFLQGVGERVVAHVVEQGGGQENADVLVLQFQGGIRAQQAPQELLGQVEHPQGVLEAGVPGPRINQVDVA